MSGEIKQQLKNLKIRKGRINPDLDWVLNNRRELLNKINGNSFYKENNLIVARVNKFIDIFIPRQVAAYARPLVVSMLAISIVVGGWIAGVDAVQKSLPGEALWNVKLAGEKTQVTLVSVGSGSKSKEAELYLDFANKRAEEIKEVIKTKENVSKSVDSAVQSLKKSIDSANKTIEKAVSKEDTNALNLAEKTDKKVEQILVVLEETKDAVIIKKDDNVAMEKTKQIINNVSDAAKAVEVTGIKTMELLVNKTTGETKQDQTNQNEFKTTVIDKINKRITDLEAEFASIKKSLGDIEALFASSTVSTVNKTESIQIAEIKDIVLSTSTVTALSPNMNTSTEILPAKDLKQLVLGLRSKIIDSENFVSSTLSETKELVGKEDLSAAFEKTKQLSNLNSELKKLLEDIFVDLINSEYKKTEDLTPVDETSTSTINSANVVNSNPASSTQKI